MVMILTCCKKRTSQIWDKLSMSCVSFLKIWAPENKHNICFCWNCISFFALLKENVTWPRGAQSMQKTARQNKKKTLLFLSHLKSGIPAEVLIPAPEWTTKYWDSLISWARVSTLAFSSSGLSKCCSRREKCDFKSWPREPHSNQITMNKSVWQKVQAHSYNTVYYSSALI